MQPVDVAFQRFKELRTEIGSYIDTVSTEADTRLKVIDPILLEVLLWPMRDVLAEPATASGFVDYSLGRDGRSRLIVEAKRDARSLGCESRQAKRGYKLNGGIFNEPSTKKGGKPGDTLLRRKECRTRLRHEWARVDTLPRQSSGGRG